MIYKVLKFAIKNVWYTMFAIFHFFVNFFVSSNWRPTLAHGTSISRRKSDCNEQNDASNDCILDAVLLPDLSPAAGRIAIL